MIASAFAIKKRVRIKIIVSVSRLKSFESEENLY